MSDYETNICICHLLCFGRQFDPLKDLVIYTQAKFQQLVGEILNFEFDAYRITFPGASDLKLFVGGVDLIIISEWQNDEVFMSRVHNFICTLYID